MKGNLRLFFILGMYLFIQILKFANNWIVNIFLSDKDVVRFIIYGFIILVLITILSKILKTFFSKKFNNILWGSLFIIGLLLFVLSHIFGKQLSLASLSFMLSIGIYGSVYAEAKVMQTIEEKLKFRRIYLLLISSGVFISSFIKMPNTFHYSNVIILSSIALSFLISYFINKEKKENFKEAELLPARTILMSLVPIFISLAMYYFQDFFSNENKMNAVFVPSISIFYFYGTMFLYGSLNDYIKRTLTIKRITEPVSDSACQTDDDQKNKD